MAKVRQRIISCKFENRFCATCCRIYTFYSENQLACALLFFVQTVCVRHVVALFSALPLMLCLAGMVQDVMSEWNRDSLLR